MSGESPGGSPGESPTDGERESVELGDLHTILNDRSYPVTTEELLDALGHVEIQFEDGGRTFEDVLGQFPGESFHSSDAVRMAVISLVNEGAVGR